MEHAMRFFDYVIERGSQPIIKALDAPPEMWDSPLAAFEAAYKHEQFITQCIYELVDLSSKNKDYATNLMLQWYVKEQVEEESTVSEIIYRLKMMGDFTGGLIFLDSELRKRAAK
jgi:ferritin